MIALALFVASFAVVFLVGLQQMNVAKGYLRGAFITSMGIGLASLLQFKVLPGPTDWLTTAAYLFGSALGIVASIKAHPAIEGWIAGWREGLGGILQLEQRDPVAIVATDDGRQFEIAGMAKTIADECAISDIERECARKYMSSGSWYDTDALEGGDAEYSRRTIDRAIRYLDLREVLIRHSIQPALVRFKS